MAKTKEQVDTSKSVWNLKHFNCYAFKFVQKN